MGASPSPAAPSSSSTSPPWGMEEAKLDLPCLSNQQCWQSSHSCHRARIPFGFLPTAITHTPAAQSPQRLQGTALPNTSMGPNAKCKQTEVQTFPPSAGPTSEIADGTNVRRITLKWGNKSCCDTQEAPVGFQEEVLRSSLHPSPPKTTAVLPAGFRRWRDSVSVSEGSSWCLHFKPTSSMALLSTLSHNKLENTPDDG